MARLASDKKTVPLRAVRLAKARKLEACTVTRMKNIMRHAGVPMIGKDGAAVFAHLAKLILTNIATSAEREAHFDGRVTVKYKDTVQALRRAKMIAPFVLAKQKKRAAFKHKVEEKTQNA